jgi:hypothetical protein
MAPIPPGT